MKIKLQQQNVNFSQLKISGILHNAEITRKRVKSRCSLTQTLVHLKTKKVYSREIQVLSNEVLIFLDETRFNLHTGPKYGYSPKNTDAYWSLEIDSKKSAYLLA